MFFTHKSFATFKNIFFQNMTSLSHQITNNSIIFPNTGGIKLKFNSTKVYVKDKMETVKKGA